MRVRSLTFNPVNNTTPIAMTNQFRVVASVLFVSLLVAGCDKTADEYHQEKVNQKIALYNQVAGDYRGSITDGNVTIGDILIHLQASTVTVNNGDDTSQTSQAQLNGN